MRSSFILVVFFFLESDEFLLRMERGEVVDAFENGWSGRSFLRFRQVRVDQKQAAVRRAEGRAGQAGELLVQRPWGWDELCMLEEVREELCGWYSWSLEDDRGSLQTRHSQHPAKPLRPFLTPFLSLHWDVSLSSGAPLASAVV